MYVYIYICINTDAYTHTNTYTRESHVHVYVRAHAPSHAYKDSATDRRIGIDRSAWMYEDGQIMLTASYMDKCKCGLIRSRFLDYAELSNSTVGRGLSLAVCFASSYMRCCLLSSVLAFGSSF